MQPRQDASADRLAFSLENKARHCCAARDAFCFSARAFLPQASGPVFNPGRPRHGRPFVRLAAQRGEEAENDSLLENRSFSLSLC